MGPKFRNKHIVLGFMIACPPRGHKKEASAVKWHPVHEGIFASGGSDGSVMFWQVGTCGNNKIIKQ